MKIFFSEEVLKEEGGVRSIFENSMVYGLQYAYGILIIPEVAGRGNAEPDEVS